MKLFNKKIGTQVININGERVKFVNCIAEVTDEFGAEALKLGLPDLYEYGKQPVYETPKEVALKSDFAEKEEWYKNECARLQGIADTRKKKIEELEAEVALWKGEYQKEHDKSVALFEAMQAANGASQPAGDPAPEEFPVEAKNEEKQPEEQAPEEAPAEYEAEPTKTDEELRAELKSLKKDELIAFAVESGIAEEGLAEKTKAEIIEEIIALAYQE